jgi:hypothetical protein
LRNDRRIGVLNGMAGTIARRIGTNLVITTDDGERALPAPYLADGHLGHAYALTVYKAQGLTVERAFVLATPALTQEAGYVALSRARAGSELFVSLQGAGEDSGHDPRRSVPSEPLDETRRRLATSRAKGLALAELDGDAAGDNRNGDDSVRGRPAAGHREQLATYRVVHGATGVGDAAMAEHVGLDRDPSWPHPGLASEPSAEPKRLAERMRVATAATRAAELDRERRTRDLGRGR